MEKDLKELLRKSGKEQTANLERAKQQISIFESDTSEALVDDSLNLCLQNFKGLIEAGVADAKTISLMTKVIDAYVKVENLKVKQMVAQEEASQEQVGRILNKLKELEADVEDTVE